MNPPEQVVLLTEDGQVAGTADKSTVHTRDTPLHLAFSCYIFDEHGRLLVTRRAVGKRTWPGVWTNSCCGHPAPGEALTEAVHRRVDQELGVRLSGLTCVLPDFRYRAVAPDGIVEHEICPVYTARTGDTPTPDPSETEQWEWVPWERFRAMVLDTPWALSPWAVKQTRQLDADDVIPED